MRAAPRSPVMYAARVAGVTFSCPCIDCGAELPADWPSLRCTRCSIVEVRAHADALARELADRLAATRLVVTP